MDLEKLKQVIDYKWRVQSFYPKDNPTKASCVAYIDARQVMDLLDEVVGPENWQSDFKRVGENLFGGIAIYMQTPKDGLKWVWKWDCGTEGNIEKEKSEASDALKRAAVQWGIGRFLYELEILTVPAGTKNGKSYVFNEQGNALYSNDEITFFCNLYYQRKYGSNKEKEKKEEKHEEKKEEKNEAIILGDKLIKSHLISDKEKETWEKNKNNPEKRSKAIAYLEGKIRLGEDVERSLGMSLMAKIKDGETKAIIKDKTRKIIEKEFTPMNLTDAAVKYVDGQYKK